MITRLIIAAAAGLLSIAAVLAVVASRDNPPSTTPVSKSVAHFTYAPVRSLKDESQFGAQATVTTVKQLPTISVYMGPQVAPHKIEHQLVSYKTTQAVDGTPPSSFDVEVWGRGRNITADGPDQQAGSDEVVFVSPEKHTGLLQIVGGDDQGRFIVSGGRLHKIGATPVSDQLDGLTVAEAKEALQ